MKYLCEFCSDGESNLQPFPNEVLIYCDHCDYIADYTVNDGKETTKCFEVYLKNPDTGETGWEIEFIEVTAVDPIAALEHYPNFDCIIMEGYYESAVKFHYGEK